MKNPFPRKTFGISILMFSALISLSNKCDSPEECDCDELIAHDESIRISTLDQFPISFGVTYSRKGGISLDGSLTFPIGATGLSVTLTETLSDPNSTHNVKLILRNNHSIHGWGDRIYYLENTDRVAVHIIHGWGEETIEYANDVVTIDLTKEKSVKLLIKVNDVYNPTDYSTNKILKVNTSHLNVRYSAGKDAKLYDVLDKGETVYLLGNSEMVGNSEWVEVCYNDYKVWLNSRYVD